MKNNAFWLESSEQINVYPLPELSFLMSYTFLDFSARLEMSWYEMLSGSKMSAKN